MLGISGHERPDYADGNVRALRLGSVFKHPRWHVTYELKPCPKPVRVRRERKPLRAKKRIKAKNARRGGHAFPKNVDEPYREHIRGLPCVLADRCCYLKGGIPLAHICIGRTQACHVKTRGSGGEDRNNLYPGCGAAHDQQHVIGIPAFNKLWGLDLAFLAQRYTEMYEAEKFPCP